MTRMCLANLDGTVMRPLWSCGEKAVHDLISQESSGTRHTQVVEYPWSSFATQQNAALKLRLHSCSGLSALRCTVSYQAHVSCHATTTTLVVLGIPARDQVYARRGQGTRRGSVGHSREHRQD